MNISNINLNASSQSTEKNSHSNFDNSSLLDKNKQNEDIKNKVQTATDLKNNGQVSKEKESESLTSGYSKDQETGQMIWQLKDSETGQVVQQLPPEYQLKIEESISNYLKTYDKSGQTNTTIQAGTGKNNNGLIIDDKS